MNLNDVSVEVQQVQNELMRVLYDRFGEEGSWEKTNGNFSFDLGNGFQCSEGCELQYVLPTGYEASHSPHILIGNDERERYISIDISPGKTDKLKSLSHDMNRLKNTYGDSLLGVLVYIKDKGVDIRHAEICYPFDYFFDIFPESLDNPDSWDELMSKISEFLEAENE